MAKVLDAITKIAVSVEVTYAGKYPLDQKRKEYIERKLQEFADGDLRRDLISLRYNGES